MSSLGRLVSLHTHTHTEKIASTALQLNLQSNLPPPSPPLIAWFLHLPPAPPSLHPLFTSPSFAHISLSIYFSLLKDFSLPIYPSPSISCSDCRHHFLLPPIITSISVTLIVLWLADILDMTRNLYTHLFLTQGCWSPLCLMGKILHLRG